MIEIRCADGRSVVASFPEGSTITAAQFAIIRQRAIDGKTISIILE